MSALEAVAAYQAAVLARVANLAELADARAVVNVLQNKALDLEHDEECARERMREAIITEGRSR